MTISEITAKTAMPDTTLRYYERIGVLPAVPRDEAGNRIYDTGFIRWVNLVQRLKSSGMSLEHIKKYVKLAQMGDSTKAERHKLLADTRRALQSKIAAFQSIVGFIDYQLNECNNTL